MRKLEDSLCKLEDSLCKLEDFSCKLENSSCKLEDFSCKLASSNLINLRKPRKRNSLLKLVVKTLD